MTPQKLAIIDIGSKTVRLSIYAGNGQMEEIRKDKVSLRLSEHIVNGSLSQSGLQQLIHVLKGFNQTIHSYEIEAIECIATAAIRNANNQKEILLTVKKHTPFSIRLLSGKEEAQYGLLAITQSIAKTDGVAVDLGGGSTEITLFRNRQLVRTVSLSFGVVTLAKRFSELSLSEAALHQLTNYVKDELAPLTWIKGLRLPIIGIGGSVRLIGKYSITHKKLHCGLNGYSIANSEVQDIFAEMEAMPTTELSNWAKDNADLALPALSVLSELMNWTESEEIICCTKGIKDGLIYAKLNS